ncbi:two-component system, chemotaxis family, response regulator CheY [Roseivivax halotolerans]|jgi:two-component system chemotaxis response regulator CheY|uniref:Two-component system, chemotaxis family, response regulator CheY n=1 Tax=Roseivivax halotolerans TaxID=93684 RepID=A0A1I5ZEQ4_9RHOB|nr:MULTISPECIES: response regulator [Roseivivax]QFT63276.1 Response regulator MprA [Roseivivax sp. THAF30]SFQ54974.1 two-component system, chemotaxis family, response regulator CheY [Roseivivax halotolerans]
MTIKVLAIDDSRTIREMLRFSLTQNGFDVAVAEDGRIGVDSLAEIAPDVVITDINMPRLDGFGVISEIRNGEVHPSVPILVLTTESAAELKDRARKSGATGWIVKPFDDEKLVSAIRRIASVRRR